VKSAAVSSISRVTGRKEKRKTLSVSAVSGRRLPCEVIIRWHSSRGEKRREKKGRKKAKLRWDFRLARLEYTSAGKRQPGDGRQKDRERGKEYRRSNGGPCQVLLRFFLFACSLFYLLSREGRRGGRRRRKEKVFWFIFIILEVPSNLIRKEGGKKKKKMVSGAFVFTRGPPGKKNPK